MFDVHCNCGLWKKLPDSMAKMISFSMRAFESFLSIATCNFIWNLKRIVIWKVFLQFHVVKFFSRKTLWFHLSCALPTSSHMSWAIVLNKLRNNLSKMTREKKHRKGIGKKVRFGVFIFLSHKKTTESYATKLGLTTDDSNDSTIRWFTLLPYWMLNWMRRFCGFTSFFCF